MASINGTQLTSYTLITLRRTITRGTGRFCRFRCCHHPRQLIFLDVSSHYYFCIQTFWYLVTLNPLSTRDLAEVVTYGDYGGCKVKFKFNSPTVSRMFEASCRVRIETVCLPQFFLCSKLNLGKRCKYILWAGFSVVWYRWFYFLYHSRLLKKSLKRITSRDIAPFRRFTLFFAFSLLLRSVVSWPYNCLLIMSRR